MKGIIVLLIIVVLVIVLFNPFNCRSIFANILTNIYTHSVQTNYYNATDYGLSTTNTGEENSRCLQELINTIPLNETIYIPSGEYKFAETGQQSIGSYCIKMRSHVKIVGDGESTVLLPVGNSNYGLDMFYFNELLDSGSATYLQYCTFKNFVIDASGTSSNKYTSAGKGFMFNLYKDCHWKNVIVKNTDATGFGMDCPIDCTIINCKAINCGKAATTNSNGASGFGIGFGYSTKENIEIRDCVSIGNKKFGFFFEHQGRFNSKIYQSDSTEGFLVDNCEADNNYYNFGGIVAMDVTYSDCVSKDYIKDDFYFEDSKNCTTTCETTCETDNKWSTENKWSLDGWIRDKIS